MYCTNCGSEMAEGQAFCSNCGAKAATPEAPRAETAMPKHSRQLAQQAQSIPQAQPAQQQAYTPQPAYAPQQPMQQVPQASNKKGPALIIAIVIAVIAVVAIAAFAIIGMGAGKPSDVTVYYASQEAAKVLPETKIVVYDEAEKPFETYTVTLSPTSTDTSDSDTKSSESIQSIIVEGTTGFSVSDFGSVAPGSYVATVSVPDQPEYAYNLPVLEVVRADSDEAKDVAPTLKVVPNPKDPESAKTEAKPEFKATLESVKFSYRAYTMGGLGGSTTETEYFYPQYSSSIASKAPSKVNESIEKDIEECKSQTLNESGDEMPMLVTNYDICPTYLEGAIASTYSLKYEYAGGAHGSRWLSGTTYDLEADKEVPVWKALDMEKSEFRDKASDAIWESLRQHPSDIYKQAELASAIDEIVSDENRFYIDAEYGVVVVSEDYELGSYASGPRRILVIPFEGSGMRAGDMMTDLTDITGSMPTDN